MKKSTKKQTKSKSSVAPKQTGKGIFKRADLNEPRIKTDEHFDKKANVSGIKSEKLTKKEKNVIEKMKKTGEEKELVEKQLKSPRKKIVTSYPEVIPNQNHSWNKTKNIDTDVSKPQTVAEELWSDMKDHPMEMFGVTKTVSDFLETDRDGNLCAYTNIDPNKLFLRVKASGMIVAIEEVMNHLQNFKYSKTKRRFKDIQITETGTLTIELESIPRI